MNLLENICFLYCSFIPLIDSIEAEDLEKTSRKQTFCGKKLTNVLGQFCSEYPDPENDHQHLRVKRQIISECCQNKCSLIYLLDNYCHKINIEALDSFKNGKDDGLSKQTSTPPTTAKQINYRQKYSLKKLHYINIDDAPSPQRDYIRKKHRKKRNCSCKNRLKLKKLRRERKLLRRLSQNENVMRESQIGEIDDNQGPFYILIS